MAGRWRDPAAFRAAPSAAPALRPSRRQAGALLAVLVLVAGIIAAVSYVVKPDRARAFDLYNGSLFLADSLAPVSVDLASGRPTVRLINAGQEVGAKDTSSLAVVPLDQGTLLLNSATGEFNMVASTGFVVKTTGGVPLAARPGSTGAVGFADGSLAYIEQTGPTGTSVYLVGQSTIETASNAGARARPRAFRSMPDIGTTSAGGAAAANGGLWLLVGSGSTRTVRQLSLPANSDPGVTLRQSDHGTVAGAAALESATVTSSPGTSTTGPSVVGVAAADQIRLFDGTTASTVHFSAVAGADQVLPSSNAEGRLSWLIHGSKGWSVVSVAADGSGLRGPTLLTGIAAGASLAPAAASNGDLYTMDRSGGQIIRIDTDQQAQAIPGADRYPLAEQNGKVIEPGGYGDAYAIARGSRVILNSPSHLDALVLFTDNSHAPLTIAKSSAVSVNATGGADALTRSRADTKTGKTAQPKGAPKPKPQAADPVNNKINCATAQQKPHIPTFLTPVPGSRSVLLSWTYPLIDPQDCEPSTYVLSISSLTDSSPSPPSRLTVQAQKSVNLSGLFPSTRYQITVTAYINGQGTASTPIQVTTGPEGPAAPKDVSATPDDNGNWNITWASCGTTKQGCVPASSWKVIPEFCDGLGLSSAPTPLSITADPTTSQQPPAQLVGGDALLGRGVRFQVEGIGLTNAVGDPSGFTPCTYSWRPPTPGAITFSATTPTQTDFGAQAGAVVTLHFSGDADAVSGGVGAMYTYRLSGGGRTTTLGPTTHTTERFTGAVAPGTTYTASVSVAPPRHPGSTLDLGTKQVQTSSNWPTVTMGQASITSDSNDFSSGTMTLPIGGVSSSASDGERFAFSGLTVVCGSTAITVSPPDSFDPAQSVSFAVSGITPAMYNTTCSVGFALVEANPPSPSFYGGAKSKQVSGSVSMPTQPPTGVGNPGITAQFERSANGAGQSVLDVNASGLGGKLQFFSSNWSEVASDGHTQNCGSASVEGSVSFPVDQNCVQETGPTSAGWTVTVSYTLLIGGQQTQTVQVAADPSPPSYRAPCVVSAGNFAAAWGGTVDAPTIALSYTQNTDQLGGCQNFSFAVQPPLTAVTCQTPDPQGGLPTAGPYTFAISCTSAPPGDGWMITVQYGGTAGGHTFPVAVTGTPPT